MQSTRHNSGATARRIFTSSIGPSIRGSNAMFKMITDVVLPPQVGMAVEDAASGQLSSSHPYLENPKAGLRAPARRFLGSIRSLPKVFLHCVPIARGLTVVQQVRFQLKLGIPNTTSMESIVRNITGRLVSNSARTKKIDYVHAGVYTHNHDC